MIRKIEINLTCRRYRSAEVFEFGAAMPGFAIKCFAIVIYKIANVAKGRKKNTVILQRKNARVQKKSTDVQHTCTNVDSSAYTTLSNLVMINIGL